MPLLSKHHDKHAVDQTQHTAPQPGFAGTGATGTAPGAHGNYTGGPGPATTGGVGTATGAQGYDHNLAGVGAGHPNLTGPAAHPHAATGGAPIGASGASDPYGAAGVGTQAVPHASAVNQTHHGPGHALAGKVEHAVGSLLGSQSLKAKGLQKEQEAGALKVQGVELAEAERLEREAVMRRERAVAHGAHPHNKHLGGAGAETGINPTGMGEIPGGYNEARGHGGNAY